MWEPISTVRPKAQHSITRDPEWGLQERLLWQVLGMGRNCVSEDLGRRERQQRKMENSAAKSAFEAQLCYSLPVSCPVSH